MPAEMYRVPASEVHGGKFKSVIQDNGMLRRAVRDSHGNYLFSEVGAGVQPLALVGDKNAVLYYLSHNEDVKIKNLIEETPEIYMSVGRYNPGSRYVSLDPVGDSTVALVKGAAGFAPGGIITDIGGAIADILGIGKDLTKKKKKKASAASLDLYIMFHYLPGEGMTQIATKSIKFKELYNLVYKGIWQLEGGALGAAQRAMRH